ARKPLSELLLDEVATPQGLPDEIYFGMPESEHHRLARLEDAESAAQMVSMMSGMPPDMPMMRAAPMSLYPTAELGNRTDILSADIPAGGKTSARAIARMYAALLGEVDGVRLISPERLREATAVSASGVDAVFDMRTRWAR